MSLWSRIKAFFGFSPAPGRGEPPEEPGPPVQAPRGVAPELYAPPPPPPATFTVREVEGRPAIVLAWDEPPEDEDELPEDEDELPEDEDELPGWSWFDEPEDEETPELELRGEPENMAFKGGLLRGEEGSLLTTLDSWLDKYQRSTLSALSVIPTLDITLPDGSVVQIDPGYLADVLTDTRALLERVLSVLSALGVDTSQSRRGGWGASSAGGYSERYEKAQLSPAEEQMIDMLQETLEGDET